MNNDEYYGQWCENCHISTGLCDCPKGDCVECDDYRGIDGEDEVEDEESE